MTEFLVKHFVKDYEKTEKVSVRTGYGNSGEYGRHLLQRFIVFDEDNNWDDDT